MTRRIAVCSEAEGHVGRGGHGHFHTTALVSQGWLVDEVGNFLGGLGDEEVFREPDDDNYTCAVDNCGGEVEWIDADTGKDPVVFEISREFILSTAHMTRLDSELLASCVDAADPSFTVDTHCFGWRLYLKHTDARHVAKVRAAEADLPEGNRFSPSFWKCIDLATELDVDWLRFDQDGRLYEGALLLDVVEW